MRNGECSAFENGVFQHNLMRVLLIVHWTGPIPSDAFDHNRFDFSNDGCEVIVAEKSLSSIGEQLCFSKITSQSARGWLDEWLGQGCQG